MYPFPFYPHFDYIPVIPKIYYDVKSPEQRIKMLCCEIDKLINYADAQTEQINVNSADIAELKCLFAKFQESGFDDYYLEQVEKWLESNMWCIMSWASRTVWFGLSDDGYFTAYVPDNYNFLDFDVIMDAESPDYGKLVLSYCQEVYEPCEITCWDADCDKSEALRGFDAQMHPAMSVLTGEGA